MFAFAVEFGRDFQFTDHAVDAGAYEALGKQVVQQLLVFALAVLHYRGQQQYSTVLRQGHDPIDHLADGAGSEGHAVLGAAWFADPRKQ